MLITDFLKEESIQVGVDATDKENVINQLMNIVICNNPDIDMEKALSGIYEREKLGTTGIGDGVAIPHTRIDCSGGIRVALCTLKNEIDFNSIDQKPVSLVFLILYPKDQIRLQLRFLARVSRLLMQKGLTEELIKCTTSSEVLEILTHYESTHFH